MSTEKRVLLVVEDEPMMRKLLLHIFKDSYDVVVQENGREALDWLKAGHTPHAVLADLNMPEMDGYEFIETVRKFDYYNSVPLVVLSGEQESQDRVRCLRLGADDFITKPFNPEELHLRLNKLQELLSNRGGINRMDGVQVLYKNAQ